MGPDFIGKVSLGNDIMMIGELGESCERSRKLQRGKYLVNVLTVCPLQGILRPLAITGHGVPRNLDGCLVDLALKIREKE